MAAFQNTWTRTQSMQRYQKSRKLLLSKLEIIFETALNSTWVQIWMLLNPLFQSQSLEQIKIFKTIKTWKRLIAFSILEMIIITQLALNKHFIPTLAAVLRSYSFTTFLIIFTKNYFNSVAREYKAKHRQK